MNGLINMKNLRKMRADMTAEQAEVIALQALGWLVGDDDLRDVFMGATGASADALRDQAGDPAFQAAVLDFLMLDDAWVIRFCDAHGLPYEVAQQARQALPGQGQVHWT